MDLVFKIVRRLLRDDEVEFSRNKNYQAYEDPKVKRALRIFKHLKSVEDDLLRAGKGVTLETVERSDGSVVVRLSYAAGSATRTSFLNEAEWLLLLESPRVANILRTLLDDATEQTQNNLGMDSFEQGSDL